MGMIHDGRTNNTVKIDANNRMQTAAITDPIQDWAAAQEVKYNLNTGDITITNTTKITAAYVKNTEDDDLIITALIYNIGTSTNGTGDTVVDVIRNPTAGGIITNANDMLVGPGESANQNFGSSRILSGLFYKGAQGETAVSGGATTITSRLGTGPTRAVVSLGAIVIPKNKAIAVDFTPPASNTSQTIQIAFACYLKTNDVEAQ
jgi:hypothetical protein